MPVLKRLDLHDFSPEHDTFREEALGGLQQSPKKLPPKYFYDERGSRLFDEITTLEEYYLTRTETALMQQYADEMVASLGPDCLLVEYGSGSSIKTRILLDHLPDAAGYIPIDISRKHLMASATQLATLYPDLTILPVCADYHDEVALPQPEGHVAHTVVYFPGSTIGNFERTAAVGFLRHIADVCGPGGGLLIGVDLKKEVSILEAAYNDARGVTADFNKNILLHLNDRLEGTFAPEYFTHKAVFNAKKGRIEMYLISLTEQCVTLGGQQIPFEKGEALCTEYSYKYSLDDFAALADQAGFDVAQVWTDEKQYFSVQFLVAR